MIRAIIITFTVVAVCLVLLLAFSRFSHHTFYQFTTYQIEQNNEIRTMTWVSKTTGRVDCSELALFKRNQISYGEVIDSFCVDGKDNVSGWVEASYDEWLRERFNKKIVAQSYGRFKDKLGHDSLIYFSNSNHSSDQNILEALVDRIKGKASGWAWVQPSASLPTQ